MEARGFFSALLRTTCGANGTSTSGDGAAEESLEETITSLLSKLPPAFDTAAARRKYPAAHSEVMNTVLLQEMSRYNYLVAQLHDLVVGIRDAAKGIAPMSAELEDATRSILSGQVRQSVSDIISIVVSQLDSLSIGLDHVHIDRLDLRHNIRAM